MTERSGGKTLLLTGFEPFLDVAVNPSGEIARRLDRTELVEDRDGTAQITGIVLPVSFQSAPIGVREAFEAVEGDCELIVSLGVHRGPAFRLEHRAGVSFQSQKPDNDGNFGESLAALGGPEERRTSLDVDGACRDWLIAAGATDVVCSTDAGGYLCERVYREILDIGAERSIPALFLHVPPADKVPVEAQQQIVGGFLRSLWSARAAGH